MIYLLVGLIFLLVLFMYSACIVSGQCSRIEENLEMEKIYEKEKNN